MKKFLVASFLALVGINSHSQDAWTLITDSDSGTRLYAAGPSFSIEKNKHDVFVASMLFKTVKDGVPSKPLSVLIDAMSCKDGQGKMIIATEESRDDFYWDKNGTRFYDYAGVTLCYLVMTKINSNKQQQVPDMSGGTKL